MRRTWRGWLVLGVLLGLLALQWHGARASARVEAEHVYDGCGSLCYLGAFKMAAGAEGPPYRDVVRSGNPCALESDPDVLEDAARRLGFAMVVSGLTEDVVEDLLRQYPTTGRQGRVFGSLQAAERELERAVRRSEAPVVLVDLYHILEDRRRAHAGYPDVGHAGHFMVVTGFDREHIYVHDPQRPGPEARYQPLRRASFMAAWEAAGCRLEQPVRTGAALPAEQVLGELRATVPGLLAEARRLPEELRRAEGPIPFVEHRDLSSVPYRRQVLAEWLDEAHRHRAADLYRSAARVYGRIDVSTPSRRAAEVVEAGLRLDQAAWEEWSREAPGAACPSGCRGAAQALRS